MCFSVRIGGSGTVSTLWTSESSLRGKSGLGFESGVVTTVTAGRVRACLSLAGSYGGVILSASSAVRANFATTGATSVTVVGTSVGGVDLSVKGRIGGSGTVSTLWTSESSLRGKSGLGFESGVVTTVTAGTVRASLSLAASYGGVNLSPSSAVRANFATTGSTSVTVVGTSVGGVDLSVKGRIGGSGTVSTLWTSESSLRGKSGLGFESGVVL